MRAEGQTNVFLSSPGLCFALLRVHGSDVQATQ